MPRTPRPDAAIERKLTYVKRLIESDFAAPWSAKSLAAAGELTELQLRSGFRQRYAMSAVAYLWDVRLRAAADFLISGNSATQTARACGFSSAGLFSRMFLKHTGTHPSHYRFKMVGWKYGEAALARRNPVTAQAA